jgi:serine/threonine protein kinase
MSLTERPEGSEVRQNPQHYADPMAGVAAPLQPWQPLQQQQQQQPQQQHSRPMSMPSSPPQRMRPSEWLTRHLLAFYERFNPTGALPPLYRGSVDSDASGGNRSESVASLLSRKSESRNDREYRKLSGDDDRQDASVDNLGSGSPSKPLAVQIMEVSISDDRARRQSMSQPQLLHSPPSFPQFNVSTGSGKQQAPGVSPPQGSVAPPLASLSSSNIAAERPPGLTSRHESLKSLPSFTRRHIIGEASVASAELEADMCGQILTKPDELMTFIHTDGQTYEVDNVNRDLIVFVGMILLERYEVLEALGSGTFGQVVQCRDLAFTDPQMFGLRVGPDREMVAVKIIKSDHAFEHQAAYELNIVKFLHQPAQAGQAHPGRWTDPRTQNVVKCVGHGYSFGHYCLVFELLGLNLFQMLELKKYHGVSIDAVREIARQLLGALELTHEKGFKHGDVKPENIMLIPQPASHSRSPSFSQRNPFSSFYRANPSLFTAQARKMSMSNGGSQGGLASVGASPKFGSTGSSGSPPNSRAAATTPGGSSPPPPLAWGVPPPVATRPATVCLIDFGTATATDDCTFTYFQSRYYRAPEVILEAPYGSAIDVWSTGCVLIEMFLGLPLFAADNDHQLLGRIMEFCGEVPEALLAQSQAADRFYRRAAPQPASDAPPAKKLRKRSKKSFSKVKRGEPPSPSGDAGRETHTPDDGVTPLLRTSTDMFASSSTSSPPAPMKSFSTTPTDELPAPELTNIQVVESDADSETEAEESPLAGALPAGGAAFTFRSEREFCDAFHLDYREEGWVRYFNYTRMDALIQYYPLSEQEREWGATATYNEAVAQCEAPEEVAALKRGNISPSAAGVILHQRGLLEDLIMKMLTVAPHERITAKQALQHDFFKYALPPL